MKKLYPDLSDARVYERIKALKAQLGSDLSIMAHYYQRDDVVRFADFQGDSLELAHCATDAESACHIVFCGVMFMSETAAMLCKPGTLVLQPVTAAGCTMADMADAENVAVAWNALQRVWPGDVIPITYQNANASVKAFVGRNGGAVCTSANSERIFRWAFAQRGHILFLPDENLSTNTAYAMGIPPEQVGTWDPFNPPDPATLKDNRVVVWKGHCYVHTVFSSQDIARARSAHPDAQVVVHPECRPEVVQLADKVGSTSTIIRVVQQAAPGSVTFIGTEWHLVYRLARQHPDRLVLPLRRSTCGTMSMTTARHLLASLESIVAGEPQGVVQVDEQTAHDARLALDRMLEVI